MGSGEHHHLGMPARQGVVLLAATGHVVAADPAAELMFGRSTADLAGRPFESLLKAPPSPALDWTEPAAGAKTGQPYTQRSSSLCMALRADGTAFPIAYLVARVASQGICFAAFVDDLGSESPSLRDWGVAGRQLRTLVEFSPIAIWVAEDSHVILANRAACALLGFESPSEMIGKSVYELLTDSDHVRFQRHVAQALQHEGQVSNLHASLKRRDGDACDVEITLASLPDHGQTTVQMVASNITQRNLELRELQRSRTLLKGLSAGLVEAREEERRRIARELHDELGQELSALKMAIVQCARSHGLPEQDGGISTVSASLDGIMASVRRIAADLRPPMLDDLGLGDALEALVQAFSRRTGIPVRLRVDALAGSPDDKLAIALYRMVQEGLTNVARHSQATEARIDLHSAAGELMLRIQDNGVGLPADASLHGKGRFGLLGIQERAEALGGQLLLQSPGTAGTQILVRLPFQPQRPGCTAAETAAG